MAYCLGSLVELVENILHRDQYRVFDHDKIPEIQSLLENATFVRDFLASSAPAIQARVESLEDRIRDAAEKAEDVIEFHLTSQLVTPLDLQEVNQVFEYAKKEMIKIAESDSSALTVVSSRHDPIPKNVVVVGVAEDLVQLKNQLVRRSSDLETIPITGMGGIGKTTLARKLYDEYSANRSYFDTCAWATVSQEYSVRNVLLGLLRCINAKATQEMLQLTDNELGVTLHKSLFGRRYLIVLDDMWSLKAWDDVKLFFPNEKNQGSRIILTTREKIIADHVSSKRHDMRLLSQDDSWKLLREKVYGKETCSSEMEVIGRRIANSCGGLPLAIQVIGGLLSQAETNKDLWEQVEYNVSSIMANKEQFSEIFSLSYANLPHYLKPCFLYMGSFPEDFTITASKLVKLLVAEGFLYPIRDKSMEEAAMIHLNALVGRSLIFVRERKGNGDVKSYGVHDLLRNLCLKKAEEKKFIYVKNMQVHDLPQDTSCLRRVCVHSSFRSNEDFFSSVKLTSLARSLRFVGYATASTLYSSMCFQLSLLRVLNILSIVFHSFPEEILDLVNLKYLAVFCWSGLYQEVSSLRNLQTLIVQPGIRRYSELGFFDLRQLRHVRIDGIRWDPDEVERSFALNENLQTLCTILLDTLKLFLGKFPNLKKLGIHCLASDDVVDLTCFDKLEYLNCYCELSPSSLTFLDNLIFPDSIKKLYLVQCAISETVMRTIGELSNLEILKIRYCIFTSFTWEPSEGGFLKLQYLELKDAEYLLTWLADYSHFPVLRHLVIYHCSALEEIPLEIGEIETLEIIEVDESNSTVLDSARKIFEEQINLDNNLFQLRILRFQ